MTVLAHPWETPAASGIFEIPAAEYHQDPCERPSLSSSIAKLLCSQTPAHARIAHPRLNPAFQASEEAKFDLGTAAHGVLLEGDGSVEVCDFDNWQTKSSKGARDAARALGRTPLLGKDWQRVEEMVAAARRQLEWVDADPPLFTDGKAEQMLVWEEQGITCRALLDWLRDDRATVDDYKTTGASAAPQAWERTMFKIGGDIQAAFYLRGLGALGLEPEWRYVVQENYPPYALSVVTLGEDVLRLAAEKVDYAIWTWRKCMAEGHWPAYTRSVTAVSVPPWEEREWAERVAP